MPQMSWEWLAGFFDGEGSITTSGSASGAKRVYVTVVNTYEPIILTIHEFTQVGHIYTQNKGDEPAKYSNCKRTWRWTVTLQDDVDTVLGAMLPYLQVKHEQAEIARMIIRAPRQGYHMTDQEKEYRAELFARLKVLNKKGIT